jgi:spoIIIJ-associated protein
LTEPSDSTAETIDDAVDESAPVDLAEAGGASATDGESGDSSDEAATDGAGGDAVDVDAAEAATEGDSAEAATEGDSAEAVTEGDSPEARAGSHKRRLVQEGDIAADYLEGLLDIADLDGDIDMDIDGDRAAVSIAGGDLGHLVGRNGEVLDALQELTRLAVLRETGERSRLMLDIEGHRARRRVELTEIGVQAVDKVKSTGEPVSLPAMTPFERKIVHDAVAAGGLVSESEGVEPMRYVVVHPA